MERARWTDRVFDFGIPPGWLPDIIERLAGTTLRIQALTATVSDNEASQSPAGGWSVKQHVGHLIDLETLHDARIDDFTAGRAVLTAADMSNIKTKEATHNEKALHDLITSFDALRRNYVSRLMKLDDETMSRYSVHPRLQVKVRPVDMAFFTAEHDDHHLASIRALIVKPLW